MHSLGKASLSLGVLAGTGGGAYGIYNAIQTTPKISTYSELLSGTLLTSTGETHKKNWEARLISLKEEKVDTNLVSELVTIKGDSTSEAWSNLRDWCNNNINNASKGEQNKEYKNVQSYCTFSIEEKIEQAIPTATAENEQVWATGHGKISSIDETKLDAKLREAKAKQGEVAKKAVKDWCTNMYKKPYKGEKDQDFTNAKIICVTA